VSEPFFDAADASVYEIRTSAPGPPGTLPVTAEMLRNSPSGDLFGWTQDAGMGWDPRALGGRVGAVGEPPLDVDLGVVRVRVAPELHDLGPQVLALILQGSTELIRLRSVDRHARSLLVAGARRARGCAV